MTASVNKRAHQRTKTLYKGRIVIEGRFSLIDCTVRDLSDGGALIEFGAAYAPPPEFELEIPIKHIRRWARSVWSSELRHGVTFFEPHEKGAMAALSEEDALQVQRILEEARQKIAEAIGAPPEQVRLDLDLTKARA